MAGEADWNFAYYYGVHLCGLDDPVNPFCFPFVFRCPECLEAVIQSNACVHCLAFFFIDHYEQLCKLGLLGLGDQ